MEIGKKEALLSTFKHCFKHLTLLVKEFENMKVSLNISLYKCNTFETKLDFIPIHMCQEILKLITGCLENLLLHLGQFPSLDTS